MITERKIERAGPDDWERVRAVRLRALVDAPDAFWETAEQARARPPASWREQLAASEAATFLACHDSLDVGLAGGAPRHHNRAEAGLYAVWVDPRVRSAGIGADLVNAVVEWARASGYRCLRLYVGDDNASAVRLYARMGFEATGATMTLPAPRAHVQEHERILQL